MLVAAATRQASLFGDEKSRHFFPRGCGSPRAPFSARIAEEGRPNDLGGAVGTGGEEEPPLPRSCPYVRPLVQAANGIDSIKRRGNEEERETPSCRLPSRQRGTKGKEQGLPEFRVG